MALTMLKPRLATSSTSAVRTVTPSWRAEKTSTERGYGYRWQKARATFLSAHPLCCMCEANGRFVAATVVDHRTPHRGDQTLFWDSSNWQSLCATCHSSAKQRMEARGDDGSDDRRWW
jgi:5-methylcytosine-specific restriction endonuclease McrA